MPEYKVGFSISRSLLLSLSLLESALVGEGGTMDDWFTTLGEHGGHTHTREVDTGNTAAEREREDTRVSPSR